MHNKSCASSRQRQGLLRRRPTVGLPPDALPLSGVLFSQSLIRPATPVFIPAASCLDKVKGQLSLVVIGNGPEQEVPVNWALSSPALLQSHRQLRAHALNLINHPLVHLLFYLERAPATSRWAEHASLLPHALDVSNAVGDHGQIHRSRGSRLLVLPLQGQNGLCWWYRRWQTPTASLTWLQSDLTNITVLLLVCKSNRETQCWLPGRRMNASGLFLGLEWKHK